MLFVFDVGNTNIVLGVYSNEKLIDHWRIATSREKTSDEYGMLIHELFRISKLNPEDIEGIIISSVVPPVNYTLEHMCRKWFNRDPLVVGPGIKTGINIKYDNPKEVGADRIVNAVAAYEMYGGPCIIIDFGTATTFCAISKTGDYLGGAICPGIKIAAESLFQHAAKLPRVELVKPNSIICKNTVSSMQSGIIYGYIGQVDYIVRKMQKELGTMTNVVATGGMARLISSDSDTIQVVSSFLTLEGLRIIYEKNVD